MIILENLLLCVGLNIQKKVIKNLRKALRLNEKIVNDEDEDNIESITYNFTEIIGNTFHQTPTWLGPKRCTINPQNDDNKCFQYAVTLFLYHQKIGRNSFRVSKIKPFDNNLDWNNINFSPQEQDYKTFEMNNKSIQC